MRQHQTRKLLEQKMLKVRNLHSRTVNEYNLLQKRVDEVAELLRKMQAQVDEISADLVIAENRVDFILNIVGKRTEECDLF